MFTGNISYESLVLIGHSHYVYGKGWSLEGKTWNPDKMKRTAILAYAQVIYVLTNGDLFYHADQNHGVMPIVRVDDRNRVYDVLESIGVVGVPRNHMNVDNG